MTDEKNINNGIESLRDRLQLAFQRIETLDHRFMEIQKTMNEKCVSLERTIDTKLSRVDRELAETKVLIETMKKLPETLHKLELTLDRVKNSLESLEESSNSMGKKIDSIDNKYDEKMDFIESQYKHKIEKMEKDIKAQENRGTVDIISFITKNFWKILICLIGGGLLVKDLFIF